MRYKIKYKDLIRKFKPFADNKVVMVASNGEVSFYDEEGMFRITHLVEKDDGELVRVVEDNEL
ncbi:hypothetical protein SAMN04487851_11424 [Prevotella sp. tc2-28]|nr:hypothetical protein SAMN04487851_11424 [Prevotella sp. tc2-28]